MTASRAFPTGVPRQQSGVLRLEWHKQRTETIPDASLRLTSQGPLSPVPRSSIVNCLFLLSLQQSIISLYNVFRTSKRIYGHQAPCSPRSTTLEFADMFGGPPVFFIRPTAGKRCCRNRRKCCGTHGGRKGLRTGPPAGPPA